MADNPESDPPPETWTFTSESGVSRSGDGVVVLRWNDHTVPIGVDAAREVAGSIMESALSAEYDAAVVRMFLAIGDTVEQAASFLRALREHRAPTGGASPPPST